MACETLEIQSKNFVLERTYIPTNNNNENLSKMSFKFICPLFQGFDIVKLNSLPFPHAFKILANVNFFNYNVKNGQFP